MGNYIAYIQLFEFFYSKGRERVRFTRDKLLQLREVILFSLLLMNMHIIKSCLCGSPCILLIDVKKM